MRCERCVGGGKLRHAPTEKCNICGGSGELPDKGKVVCGLCQGEGKGEWMGIKFTCTACGGRGTYSEAEIQEIQQQERERWANFPKTLAAIEAGEAA